MDDSVYQRLANPLADHGDLVERLPDVETSADPKTLSADDVESLRICVRKKGSIKLDALTKRLGKPLGIDVFVSEIEFKGHYDIDDRKINRFGLPGDPKIDEARKDIRLMEEFSGRILNRDKLKALEILSISPETRHPTSAVSSARSTRSKLFRCIPSC